MFQASLSRANDHGKRVIGGQFGLASKEFTPKHAVAAFDNLLEEQPKHNFVVGINDDVTHTSLTVRQLTVTRRRIPHAIPMGQFTLIDFGSHQMRHQDITRHVNQTSICSSYRRFASCSPP